MFCHTFVHAKMGPSYTDVFKTVAILIAGPTKSYGDLIVEEMSSRNVHENWKTFTYESWILVEKGSRMDFCDLCWFNNDMELDNSRHHVKILASNTYLYWLTSNYTKPILNLNNLKVSNTSELSSRLFICMLIKVSRKIFS